MVHIPASSSFKLLLFSPFADDELFSAPCFPFELKLLDGKEIADETDGLGKSYGCAVWKPKPGAAKENPWYAAAGNERIAC